MACCPGVRVAGLMLQHCCPNLARCGPSCGAARYRLIVRAVSSRSLVGRVESDHSAICAPAQARWIASQRLTAGKSGWYSFSHDWSDGDADQLQQRHTSLLLALGLLTTTSAGLFGSWKSTVDCSSAAQDAAPVIVDSAPKVVRAKAVRRLVVAREAEFPEGKMQQIMVPATANGCSEGAILLTRLDGQFFATGASCSHYSAPLAQGVAAKDKFHVVCPWHDAAFDLRTGQPVRGPGLPAIPTYAVSVENGEVIVDLPKYLEDFVEPPTASRSSEDSRVYVVIGGGAAGIAAAESLRQEGYTGRLLMLSEEKHLPYDRPVLSKNLAKASDPESIALRPAAHFKERDIEVRLGTMVKSLDAVNQEIQLASGEKIRYDKAVVATGARPRPLPVPGGNLPELLVLRTPQDAQRIATTCTAGSLVVVIGSSFVGMEVAATLKRRGCDVTVLGMEAVPFERVLGRRIGLAIKTFFEAKGARFVGGASVVEVRKANPKGLSVLLKSGQILKCDAAVVGIGVIPNCDFVKGVEKARDGSLITDEKLATAAPGLFAAGDVAMYRSQSGEVMRVEHWDVATSQGRVAAKNMVGRDVVYDQTPFFWTSIFGKNLRYVGFCPEFDELLVDGDIKSLNFAAYYCYEGQVKAVATMGRDPAAVAAGELMRQGRMPPAEYFKSEAASTASLVEMLHTA